MRPVRCHTPHRQYRSHGVMAACCLVFFALAVPQAGLADADRILVPHQTVYKGTASAAPVRVRMRLEAESNDRWVYESKVGTRGWLAWKKGDIRESSEFSFADEQIVSTAYRKKDTFSKKDRDIETRFSTDQVVSVYRGDEIVHQVAGQVFDLLNLRIKLMTDLARDRLQSHYQVVDGKGRLKTLEVRRVGEESVTTKQGEFDAIRLEYDDDDKRFLIWISPRLNYQLVRIDQHEDDKLKASLILDSYQESTD
ncbi:MAG: DUF3108 domain-containing protein [Gammaproteobacteria bacterium]